MKSPVFWLLLLCPGWLLASSSDALREYKSGNYDQALKDYQQLLDRKGDDPRLHFNAGAAAYRNRQFEEATKQFEEALKSPDLKLQEKAYYNRGNSMFYMGEHNPDPAKRTETWKKALQDFESCTSLAPQDADARFNHDFVKKRLEELQQQQQKSDKNKDDKQNPDDQQNKDKQQQNGQSKNDQQKQDQKDQQDQQKQQQQQKQQDQSQQKQDSSQQDQQQQQQQQQAGKPDEQKQKEQQAAKAGEDKKDAAEEEQQQAAAAAAGEMTPQQAAQLLDAQKGNEMMMPPKPRAKPSERAKPLKDW